MSARLGAVRAAVSRPLPKLRANPRRYPISPALARPFHVGVAPDGRQFIVGAMVSEMVAYAFDPDGRLVSREQRAWREPEPIPDDIGTYWLFARGVRGEIERRTSDWKRELGFAEAPIMVRKFFDTVFNVGIEDVPKYLAPTVSESDFGAREREAERIAWIQSKRFIFWWELDYWMTRRGM